MGHKILVLIPARFQSTRFPGKPLAKISGKTLIQWVYEKCTSLESALPVGSAVHTCVVTDSDEIEAHIRQISGNCCRVDDDVPSGSERIHLAYQRFFANKQWDLIINVQGDEPLICADVLVTLASFHLNSSFDIATLLKERTDEAGFINVNLVKGIYCPSSGNCLYFSRSPIPFHRFKQEELKWYQHIGVYSYRPSALESFSKLPAGDYEIREGLEQLRALENGLSIGAVLTQHELIGVDTPEDIKKVEGALS